MNKNLRIPLRVVFYQDGPDWIAHCLEFDLLGDGPTRIDALNRLSDAITIQAQASSDLSNPKNLFKPADPEFFLKFAAGKDVVVGEFHLKLDSITIDETETREYTDTESERDDELVRV